MTPENVGGAKKKAKSTNDSTEIRRKAVESFAYKVAVKKLAIVQIEHPDTTLTEKIVQSINREIGRHGLGCDDVTITSCHLNAELLAVSTP